MTRTARQPKKTFLPATGWSKFGAKKSSHSSEASGVSKNAGSLKMSSALEKRREHRRLRRQRKKQCFHCRQFGHAVADCPKASEQGMGICFKCGSTEHTSKDCRSKVDPSKGEYPFAKCFICGGTGHLSKQCPDNPRGIYPKGGCCKLCGSVEHKRSDCPEQARRPQKHDRTISLKRRQEKESADAIDEEEDDQHQPAPKKSKPKVVKF